jgi:hypothetical protein
VSSTKRKKWRLCGVKPLTTLKTHVPAGKRKDGGCIVLRVPNEVLSLGRTQAAVAKDSHHAMNRSGKRKKSQAGVANDRRGKSRRASMKIKVDKFLANLLDSPTSL